MKKITKVTVERLTVLANDKEKWYTKEQEIAILLLDAIKLADQDAHDHDYSENYEQGRVYYGIEGIVYNVRYDEEDKMMRLLSNTYPELVKHTACLNLNHAIIKDVNKLTKMVIAA